MEFLHAVAPAFPAIREPDVEAVRTLDRPATVVDSERSPPLDRYQGTERMVSGVGGAPPPGVNASTGIGEVLSRAARQAVE